MIEERCNRIDTFVKTHLNIYFLVITIIISMISSCVQCQGFGELLKRGIQHQPVAKRTDETYRKCLQKGSRLKEPEAVLLIEGNRLHLTCQLCLHPKVNALGVWKRLLPDSATFVPVKLDGRRSRILTDLSLEIVHIREKDSGIYFCFSDSRVLAKYAVDVAKKEPHRYIIMKGKRKGKGPSQDILLNEFNLVIGWKWSEWSECNRCQSVGRRRRVGICTLKKIDHSSPAKPVDTQILKEYKKGIPCRSNLLPAAIRNLTIIQNTKSEFMVGFCKIPCPSEASIVLVTDKTGAVVDAVDNSKGIFSMHQPLPNLPALAKRITLYEEVESSIIVTCPGNREGKFLIWRNGSYIINPSKVHVLTKGRVKIDIGNNLHIRKLRYSDAATYSCWDDKTLIATIRLQVLEKSIEKKSRIFIINTGVIFTFITVFLVVRTARRNTDLEIKE